MKLNQWAANLLLAIAAGLSALYAAGVLAGKWASVLYAVLIALKFFLVNAGYDRLPNGEVLPPEVRNLPAGRNIAAFRPSFQFGNSTVAGTEERDGAVPGAAVTSAATAASPPSEETPKP